MKVSLVQVASPPGESIAARRDRVGQLVAGCAGAELVVLPELWAPGYFAFDRYAALAESLDGDTVSAGRDWARKLECFLHLGSVLERDGDGALYNTAVLIDPDGQIAHTYRKIHVFGYQSREPQLISPGATVSVADTALGPIGATTCYDLRFPEPWRALVDAGARMVIVPAAWPAARQAHWRLFTSCRAVEEQVVVVACNAVGTQELGVLGGCSRVVDPWGQILAEAGDQEGITSCEVDLDVVARARAEFPVLDDRRRFRVDPASVTPKSVPEVYDTDAKNIAVGAQLPRFGPVRLAAVHTQGTFELTRPRLIIAGYTGRDADAVAAHIAELEAIGVAPPPSAPCFFDLDPALVTTDAVVEVDGVATSGEVEPVLIRHDGCYYLGLGSDHTDRDLERVNIAAAKAACPKPLAPTVIALPSDLGGLDWDGACIESEVDGVGYQSATLATLRRPADLWARLTEALGDIDTDLVIYAGTVPLLRGQFVAGRRWRLSLTLATGISMSHCYEVNQRHTGDHRAYGESTGQRVSPAARRDDIAPLRSGAGE